MVAPLPAGEVMVGGALVMVLAGVLSMDQAYQAIEWKTVFLVAGMLPMGIAMSSPAPPPCSPAVWSRRWAGPEPWALLAGLFVVSTLLVQAMNGPAVAAVMAPIAITSALEMGANPRAIAMGVALATSMAFLTPLGHPVNLLVMGSGGYRFPRLLAGGCP